MKNEGIDATEDYKVSMIEHTEAKRLLTMIAIYSTIFGMSPGLPAQEGSISCAKAPPNGLAKLMTAVAATLPLLVNHRSEYLVGAARTNG
jgi:hypothetical protein